MSLLVGITHTHAHTTVLRLSTRVSQY